MWQKSAEKLATSGTQWCTGEYSVRSEVLQQTFWVQTRCWNVLINSAIWAIWLRQGGAEQASRPIQGGVKYAIGCGNWKMVADIVRLGNWCSLDISNIKAVTIGCPRAEALMWQDQRIGAPVPLGQDKKYMGWVCQTRPAVSEAPCRVVTRQD